MASLTLSATQRTRRTDRCSSISESNQYSTLHSKTCSEQLVNSATLFKVFNFSSNKQTVWLGNVLRFRRLLNKKLRLSISRNHHILTFISSFRLLHLYLTQLLKCGFLVDLDVLLGRLDRSMAEELACQKDITAHCVMP